MDEGSEDLDKRVKSYLVINAGFSQRNAVEALRMYEADELNKAEKEVINRIKLYPENPDHAVLKYANRYELVLNGLNYKITMAGGDAVTKSKRRRMC